ncbi:MAG: hypothetical protein NT001_00335 [Candidatus Woesearchaeota archaeon]|nr:hypothetical protein [Candidatus Woesearchaeota archaeon]
METAGTIGSGSLSGPLSPSEPSDVIVTPQIRKQSIVLRLEKEFLNAEDSFERAGIAASYLRMAIVEGNSCSYHLLDRAFNALLLEETRQNEFMQAKYTQKYD